MEKLKTSRTNKYKKPVIVIFFFYIGIEVILKWNMVYSGVVTLTKITDQVCQFMLVPPIQSPINT